MDISNVIVKIFKWRTRLEQPVKMIDFYILGSIVLGVGFISPFLFKNPISTINLFKFGFVLISIGFTWDAYCKFKVFTQKNWLKAAIIGIPSSALVGSIAIALAEVFINRITLLDPSYFKNSVNILASLSVPFVVAFMASILLSVIYIILLARITLRASLIWIPLFFNRTPPVKTTFVDSVRAMAAMLLSAVIILGIDYIPNKLESDHKNEVKLAIALVDLYSFGECQSKYPRFKAIDNGKMITADYLEGKVNISIQDCIPKNKAQTLSAALINKR